MKKIGAIYNLLERNVLIITLAVMVTVIFTNVVMRYVFNNSLSWSEELARYMFIWFSWIGVSAGLKDGAHLRVEILSTTLAKRGLLKTNEIVNIIVDLVWLATTVIVAYYGYVVVESQMALNVVTPAMRFPVWFGYLSIPVCSAIVGLRLIVGMIDSLKKLLGKSNMGIEVAE